MNEFCSKVFSGDVRASARLMRLVDDRAEGYEEYMKEVWKHTGHAHIIGITGAPGAGKSTMTDKLIAKYRRKNSRSCSHRPYKPIFRGRYSRG